MAFLTGLRSRYQQPERLCFDVACVIGLFLALYGIDHSALWVDEADTAFMAKGVLATGYPFAFDGKQLYPGISSWYNDQYLWMEHPWLQFYVTALSFVFFEPTVLSARLPFILIGLLTLPVVYQLAKRFFDPAVARLTVVLLLYSVPYLLHIRQCRYYALATLTVMVGLWAYLKLKEEKPWAWFAFAAIAIVLFHCHYGYFFACMGGWAFWILLFDRPANWRPLTLATAVIFSGTFPWALYADLFGRHDAHGGWSFWLFVANFGYYTRVLNAYAVPYLSFPILLLMLNRSIWRKPDAWVALSVPVLLVLYLLIPDRPERIRSISELIGFILFAASSLWVCKQWQYTDQNYRQGGRFFLLFILGYVLALAVVLPLHAFRYLISLMPLFYMLLACLIVALWRRSRLLGAACGVLLVGEQTCSARCR